eukprot:gene7363-8183_t
MAAARVNIQSIDVLLGTFSKMLSGTDVHRAKRELRGHVKKECIQRIRNGRDLVELLKAYGLVGDGKLAFLHKVLQNAGLDESVAVLDEYIATKGSEKSKKTKSTEKNCRSETADAKNKNKKRSEALDKVIERQYVAVEYKKDVRQCEEEELAQLGLVKDALVDKIRFEEQAMVEIEARRSEKIDDLSNLQNIDDDICKEISKNDMDRSKIIEEITKKESKIKHLTGSAEAGKRKTVFELIIDRPEIDKLRHSIERLRKEVISTAKEREKMEYKLERLSGRRERHKDVLRDIVHEIMHKTRQLIGLEQKLMKAKEDINAKMRKIASIDLEIMELEGSMEGNKAEKQSSLCSDPKQDSRYNYAAYLKISNKINMAKFQVPKYQFIDELESYTFGASGSRLSPLQMKCPTAVSIDSSGNLVILDKGNSRILFTDVVGCLIRDPVELGVFIPVDMTISPTGRIVLISATLVKCFHETGEFDFQFLPHIERHKNIPQLVGVAVNTDEEIYVCDGLNNEIQCFCKQGTFLKFLRLDESFDRPERIAVLGRTHIVMSSIGDSCVKMIDTSNETCMKPSILGKQGVCPGEFIQPKCIALDSDRNILIADSGNHRIQVLNIHKEICATFGRLGSRQGCLDRPMSVAVHPYGLVVVADSLNDRIVVFN